MTTNAPGEGSEGIAGSFWKGSGLEGFIGHLNSLRPGCAEFTRLSPSDTEVAMPRVLSDWIGANGGPFSFFFTFQDGDEEYTGALEINPGAFDEHRAECRAWAEETWIADDPEEKQKWMEAFPFAAIGNGDYLALVSNGETAPVLYLSHENTSEIIAPSLSEFVRAWERLCYIGPEFHILEPFLDSAASLLNPSSDRARELRNQFRVDE